jgi:SAM-dependent methyltransferase
MADEIVTSGRYPRGVAVKGRPPTRCSPREGSKCDLAWARLAFPCYDCAKRMRLEVLPIPPLELRQGVSPVTDEAYYDNPTGEYVWGPLALGPLRPGDAYKRVLDFGCGCGREARRLLLQHERPKTYVGIDISMPMIDWCRRNLAGNGFSFVHHDVWNARYAPENSRNRYLPIESAGSEFTLIIATSVFTHLLDDQANYYLRQMRAMLAPNGIIRATWFFFNKTRFPTMGEGLNTLLVNEVDPTHAVYYDWQYFVHMTRNLGFRIADIVWSPMVGFHNTITLAYGEEFPDYGDSLPPGTSVIGY